MICNACAERQSFRFPSSLGVPSHARLGSSRLGDDEANTGKQLPGVKLDLSHYPTCRPGLHGLASQKELKKRGRSVSRWKPRLQGRSATQVTPQISWQICLDSKAASIAALVLIRASRFEPPRRLRMSIRGKCKRQPSIFSKGSEIQASTSGNTSLSGCRR